MSVSLSALHTRACVLDIEGTTTPVEFVHQTLFPYARAHAADYLRRKGGDPACRAALAELGAEQRADIARGDFSRDTAGQPSLAGMIEYVNWLMDRDRKSPGLKALQGLIWQEGFRAGQLRGQVYPDVPRAFERWSASGREIYIYSSGSVLAQQLLFGSSNAGDLTRFLSGYFDTAVGPKASPDSYCVIAERIRSAAPALLFVSDVTGELDAARAAGLNTALCVRGQLPQETGTHAIVHSFDEISV